MINFKNLLLCIDIDSTLIDDDHYISQKNIEAIKYFRQNGGMVTLASGRAIATVLPVAKILNIDMPVICYNGCAIYDIKTDTFIMLNTIDINVLEIVKSITKLFPSSGVEIFTKSNIYVLKSNDIVKNHLSVENIKPTFISSYDDIKGDIIKVLFGQNYLQTLELKKYFSNHSYPGNYRMLQAHNLYFEIIDKCSSKGDALKKLCKNLSISQKNVIAIGDNDNDVEMIKFANIGAAVNNASDTLKNAADIIVCDNNHSAVYDLINRLSQ